MILLSDWLNAHSNQQMAYMKEYIPQIDITYDQRLRLLTSLEVATKFFIEAHKVALKRDHYSARTIIEVLRHYSAMEDSDKTFKINNDITTPLAKVSMEMFPALNNFFQIRSPTFKLEMQNG